MKSHGHDNNMKLFVFVLIQNGVCVCGRGCDKLHLKKVLNSVRTCQICPSHGNHDRGTESIGSKNFIVQVYEF